MAWYDFWYFKVTLFSQWVDIIGRNDEINPDVKRNLKRRHYADVVYQLNANAEAEHGERLCDVVTVRAAEREAYRCRQRVRTFLHRS